MTNSKFCIESKSVIMLKFIKTIKEDILEKDIYIWNINVDSLDIFLFLGLKHINIKGFVRPLRYTFGDVETILNIPIVSIEEFNNKDNVVLIIADYCITINEFKHLINKPIFNYSDIISIDKNLYIKNVYIYGIGYGAKKITDFFNEHGIKIKGYITTEEPFKDSSIYWVKKDVKKYNAKDFNNDDIIIISVLKYEIVEEILTNLKNVNCDVYIKDYEYHNDLKNARPIYLLNKGLRENKNIFFIGDYPNYNEQAIKFLELFGLKIINKNNYNIDDLYNLSLEDQNNIVVMINEFDDMKRVDILDKIKLLGFSTSNMNVVGLQAINYSKQYLLKENDFIKDALLGYVQKYGSINSHGWKILTNFNKNNPKIMILGGSTSTEGLFPPETWMRKLYKKLMKLSFNFDFYIGGTGGYKVANEFLRFLRDGHIIKPDIVISMSGVNDTGQYVFKNKFNLNLNFDDNINFGFPSEENDYEYWLRIEKIFKMYAESLNCNFFSFLQPMNFYVPNINIECQMLNEEEESIVVNKEYLENANTNDIYINLIDLFHNQPEMFIDNCHYSDKGADILSDKVLKIIMPTVKEIHKNKKEIK